jgi:sialic acid synthase SpsE
MRNEMDIRQIFETHQTRPYLIAEIGFNHEGDMALACRMVKEAAAAGADAVKFQTFKAIDLALPSAAHFNLIKSGELDYSQHEILANEAKKTGVTFLSTPFSFEAVDLLESLDVSAFKVASMDLTNHPLLTRIARSKKTVLLSTGMANLTEIGSALNVLNQQGAADVVLMHCLSKYPAEASELSLNAIKELSEAFGIPVGYSDHHPGISACFAAGLVGARVIETHFTLDTHTPGGDHSHSANPDMLRQLIKDYEQYIPMLGGQGFFKQRPDREFAPIFRRGVFAARDLAQGHVLTMQDLLTCRPVTELIPNDLDELLGKPLRHSVAAHRALNRNDF